MAGIDEATIRRYSDEGNNGRNLPKMPPAVATKWDPAGRALLKDIAARNQQYVSEISALDETAKPLYTPESFRDAATIQQMIDQLHARVGVADKYTDWQPVFSKMKDYVATVDASEDEKRKFLAGYEATLPNTLAACRAISDKEHAWLQASLDLYQFTLAKDGAYVWHNDNLSFAKTRGLQHLPAKIPESAHAEHGISQGVLAGAPGRRGDDGATRPRAAGCLRRPIARATVVRQNSQRAGRNR